MKCLLWTTDNLVFMLEMKVEKLSMVNRGKVIFCFVLLYFIGLYLYLVF